MILPPLRWFISRHVRRAYETLARARKLRAAHADLLSPQALAALDAALRQSAHALSHNADKTTLAAATAHLAATAQACLPPYPHPKSRDHVEVFLVAIIFAISIRAFFLQPFKIPTGSMQPALFGVTLQDLRDDPAFQMPGLLRRASDLLLHGKTYHQAIARDDGQFDHAEHPRRFLSLLNRQTIWVRYTHAGLAPITLWGAPDDTPPSSFLRQIGLLYGPRQPRSFHQGQPIFQFSQTAGDHLFVDRFTYNFRPPRRGEIIVFTTRHIPPIGQDQFYIKRLIGLPGETITIGYDRHVRVNGRRLDASTPHFSNLYSFDPRQEPRENQYSGHTLEPETGSRLRTSENKLQIRPRHVAVLGDNTLDSWDSRYWGDFPQTDIIGKACFICWPISDRLGWRQP